MTYYIILNWNSIEDINIATNADGTPKLFNSAKEAARYAIDNFSWSYKVVQLIT